MMTTDMARFVLRTMHDEWEVARAAEKLGFLR
jgi:hypothetical protein